MRSSGGEGLEKQGPEDLPELSPGCYTYLLQPLHSISRIPHHCLVHTPKAALPDLELLREVAGSLGNLTEGPAERGGVGPLQ